MKTAVILILLLFASACTVAPETTQTPTPSVPEQIEQEPAPQETEVVLWQEYELTDVRTNEQYKIGSFDTPVLIESFAVWCPTCTRQQQEVAKLHESRSDFVSVSLNTDPNEDEEIVRDHAENNDFEGHYSISPLDVTQSLIDEFGLQIVNAPTVPVILLCPNGQSRQLERGVKSAQALGEAIDSCTI